MGGEKLIPVKAVIRLDAFACVAKSTAGRPEESLTIRVMAPVITLTSVIFPTFSTTRHGLSRVAPQKNMLQNFDTRKTL